MDTIIDAKINTIKTDIVALAVKGKQMTIAVYKQILQENIIDSTNGLLRGIPLGLVNYRLRDCTTKEHGHLHVMWLNSDNNLRRCCIDENLLNDICNIKIGTRLVAEISEKCEVVIKENSLYVFAKSLGDYLAKQKTNITVKDLVLNNIIIRQSNGKLSRQFKREKATARYYLLNQNVIDNQAPYDDTDYKTNYSNSINLIMDSGQVFIAM